MKQSVVIGRRTALAWGGGLAAAAMGGTVLRVRDAQAADQPASQVAIVTPKSDFNLTVSQLLNAGGYLRDFGLEATITTVSDSSKILAALISSSADICCCGGFSGVFPAIAHGSDVRIIGGGEIAPLTALFAKNPNIRSSKDLVGKTVGTGAPGSLLYAQVVALLQKQGIDPKSVTFVNIGGSPDVFKAVVTGTVDAGPGEIGYMAQMQKYGVHVLSDGLFANELPLFTIQAFLASAAAIATKRDLLVRVLAAHAKLFRFVSSPASEQAWASARAIALGADKPAEARAQWQFFQHPGRLDTNLLLSEQQTNYLQQLNVEFGVQKKVLPFARVADMSLARDALKLLA